MSLNLREVLEQDTGEGITWEPKVGEILIGEVLAVQKIDGKYGDSHFAEIQDEESGNILTVWLNSVLYTKFLQYNIGPNDFIGLKFHGEKQGTKGKPYKLYTARVDMEHRKAQKLTERGWAGDNSAQSEEEPSL